MKVGQHPLVNWVSKLVAKAPGRTMRKAVSSAQVLDEKQLRQVGGGSGASQQLPHKGW
jgi:DNA-binding protein